MSDTGSADEPWDGDSFSDRPDLYRELKRVPETSHFTLLYQSRQEQLDAALAFVKLGLENGERCLYVADESSPAEIYDGLDALGADVGSARTRDQLRVVLPAEAGLGGEFDPHGTAEMLRAGVEESHDDGFAGLRVTGETGWLHRNDVALDRVLEHETLCEKLATDCDLVALCQYDRTKLSDSAVIDLLQAHPRVIYRHRVCANPYYQPHGGVDGGGEAKLNATRLLQTIYDLATANDAIRQREQRVAVLNRVLRHNLRNEMNVIQSHAELLQDAVDQDSRQSVETILSTTDRLMEIAEDAKRVEKSVNDPERVPVDLDRALTRAAERVRTHYPGLEITVPDEGSQWVEASDELQFALVELFQTLAAMADVGATIRVDFDDERSTHARRCIRVRCQDAALPDAEIEALTQGQETQLTHGSGLGLWLVNWIVELSGGDLSFGEADAGTEEVVLSFIAA